MNLGQNVWSFFKWIWRKLRQWVRLFAQRQPRRSISVVTQSEVSSPSIHQSAVSQDAQQVGTVGERAKVARDAGRDLQQADVINNFYSNVDAPSTQPVYSSAPFPIVRLPDNYVKRPEALKAVKELLLAEDGQTLVVSAIAGLGGLGKSVLAIALVRDQEVQSRFADGILWVTLGQNPDLQTLLGDWIRQLDKSRDAYSANTKEAASQYLYNLLAEKQMLLVVDDVWNANHADWFRVGGDRCRMLVTTREAQIEGAKSFPLALMTEDEAVELVRGKLKGQWQASDEAEVKAFAKVLGYLPLALDLAANQVRDGLGWADLRCEFEAERRSVALGMGRRSSVLKLLDSSEKWDDLDATEQRKYSLQACFNLSLKRLTPEQLQQFAWLGILPEDVNLNQQVAAVLWGLRSVEAKRLLVLLRNRSFLTDSVSTLEEEPTYRIHDLMHDMARSLIEEGIFKLHEGDSEVNDHQLSLAHRQFLERYRVNCQQWDELPNDGYIHRHLTWHMVQANWCDEIHALLAMSDRLGRNAWFEACDRLGQPAIFVQDVGRAWEIAERGYEGDRVQSLVLQCRYALITATLNSLIANLPIGMMAEFVKHKFWSVEQAWAYVEQMQDERKIAEAIQALSPYLSKVLFQEALKAARSIQDESDHARVLSELAKIDGAYFSQALEAARAIQNEFSRASVLSELAKVDGAYFSELLEAARALHDDSNRAIVLSELAKVDGAYFSEALEAARKIQHESSRARILSELAKVDGAYFSEALAVVRAIQDEYYRANFLSELAKVDGAYLSEALAAARTIQNEYMLAWVLSKLAHQVPQELFSEIWNAIFAIPNKSARAIAISGSLPRLPLATLPHSDWISYLHILAHRERSDLMQDLVTLYPAILHLGGDTAMREVVNTMREICNQWK